MWDKSQQYLRKMGGVILVASIIIWFLGYFPRDKERELKYDNMITQVEQQEGLGDEEKSAQIEEIEEVEIQNIKKSRILVV
jgi:Fe2+ transport system protein B